MKLSAKVAELSSVQNDRLLRFRQIQPAEKYMAVSLIGDFYSPLSNLPGKAVDDQPVSQLQRIVVRRVLKQHGNDSVIDQIPPVDTGNAFGNDRAHSKKHGIDCRMLPAGALSIVLSSNNNALPHLPGACAEIRVVTVEAVFGHQGDVGPHGAEFRAGGGDVICGNVVPAFQADLQADILVRLFRDRKKSNVGSLHDLHFRSLFRRKGGDDHGIVIFV